jgi:hypothetical protein
MYDNPWQTSSPTATGTFYSVGTTRPVHTVKHTDWIAHINILMDIKVNQYERRVYSFYELIGSVGGFFEVFDVALFMFMGYLSNKILRYDLINTISSNELAILDTFKEKKKNIRIEQLNQSINEVEGRVLEGGVLEEEEEEEEGGGLKEQSSLEEGGGLGEVNSLEEGNGLAEGGDEEGGDNEEGPGE